MKVQIVNSKYSPTGAWVIVQLPDNSQAQIALPTDKTLTLEILKETLTKELVLLEAMREKMGIVRELHLDYIEISNPSQEKERLTE